MDWTDSHHCDTAEYLKVEVQGHNILHQLFLFFPCQHMKLSFSGNLEQKINI